MSRSDDEWLAGESGGERGSSGEESGVEALETGRDVGDAEEEDGDGGPRRRSLSGPNAPVTKPISKAGSCKQNRAHLQTQARKKGLSLDPMKGDPGVKFYPEAIINKAAVSAFAVKGLFLSYFSIYKAKMNCSSIYKAKLNYSSI
jgi:hypothetical protein